MRTARHRPAWPVAVFVVLALVVTGCRASDETTGGANPAGASTASQAPTDLDGCITAAEATLTQFQGASGEISAAIFGTGQVGVVVSNTIVGRACDWLPWARELATQGYRVMLFDYSALMPATDIPAAVDLFAKDTVEAAAKLRELGVQKVALIGGSVGGLGALLAGLDDKADADGVVCLSAAGSDEVTESVWRLGIPVLFVAANDDFRAAQMGKELYGAATSAKSRKLVLLDGALHADQLLRPTAPTKPRVDDEILAFLQAL
jgi:pimeloyl-ACP methyl ester carboxylesterase